MMKQTISPLSDESIGCELAADAGAILPCGLVRRDDHRVVPYCHGLH
jgi:hypothetical protein